VPANRAYILVAGLVAVLSVFPAPAQRKAMSENQIRAVVLLQLANYTEWPREFLGQDQTPFMVCVLGNDDLEPALAAAARGRSVGRHPVEVRKLSQASEGSTCHVIYVGYSSERQYRDALRRLESRPSLTVGEAEGFALRGGVINLTWQDGRVRFEINQDAAGRARLTLSSRLLSLGRVYGSGRGF